MTVLNSLNISLRITNRVNFSGPVSMMQLGHKAGFWNVSWGHTERWKGPVLYGVPLPCELPLLVRCGHVLDGRGERGDSLRFGMYGAPAWHKYDLNTDKGAFYLSRDVHGSLKFNGTDLLEILTHSTPNRTNPQLLFEEIDDDGDERMLWIELETFVENDPRLQELIPDTQDQLRLLEAVFDRYDGNGDKTIRLHMEWLSRSCTPTTTGPMCASCKKGHYRESRSDANCMPCTQSKTILAMVIFFTAVLFIGASGYFLHKRMSGNKQKKLLNLSMGLINEMLSYFQVGNSIIVLIAIPWPPIYLKFMTFFEVFNLNLVSLMRLDCTVPSSWSLQHTILVYAFIPLTVGTRLVHLVYVCEHSCADAAWQDEAS